MPCALLSPMPGRVFSNRIGNGMSVAGLVTLALSPAGKLRNSSAVTCWHEPIDGVAQSSPLFRTSCAYNRVMNEIQSRCITLANALADEINGNLCYVPDEEIESCLASLTESNLNETAEELAQLAAWFN